MYDTGGKENLVVTNEAKLVHSGEIVRISLTWDEGGPKVIKQVEELPE